MLHADLVGQLGDHRAVLGTGDVRSTHKQRVEGAANDPASFGHRGDQLVGFVPRRIAKRGRVAVGNSDGLSRGVHGISTGDVAHMRDIDQDTGVV